MEQRDVQVITPALELMRQYPDYCYGMESMMNLMEYLERHPERKEEIQKLTKEGRFEWGATYNQPYESLLSGEQLVREVYLGRKWIKKNLPGCDAVVAWNPDVPGRSLQMQQILRKAGIPYLMISRHQQGLYRWESPDGSTVMAFSPGHYYNSSLILGQEVPKAMEGVAGQLPEWGEYYQSHHIPAQRSMLYSQDALGPKHFGDLMKEWNSRPGAPTVLHSTAERFFPTIDTKELRLDTLKGERPNVWLYIHGPTHHWAISAKREAGVLLPAAETFSTIDALLRGSYQRYPSKGLEQAWAAAIFDDHGWGGNQGQITDQLFRSKLEFAKDKGREMLNEALASITERVKTRENKGIPILIYNALSWQRSDPVVVTLPRAAGNYQVVDSHDQPVASQELPQESNQPQGEVRITFVAQNVPAIGYKTYYAVAADKMKKSAAPKPKIEGNLCENDFYRIVLNPGGIGSIYDKQLGKELLRTDKFLGAEIFTMQSVGNGAGEFTQVQQPTMDGFDQLSRHQPQWQLCESGPVRAAFALEQKLTNCTIRQKLIVYHGLKRIDCEAAIISWTGDPYREFRLAWPLNASQAAISYEVPIGVVQVGKDEILGAAGFAYGEVDYSQPCKDVRPREVQNFINASDGNVGVTMSSSVSVCDYVDPTSNPVQYPMLQPILLASRKSCHGNGNWYLQEGDHYYRFSLFSHKPGWKNGYRDAIQANNPLLPVMQRSADPQANLPDEKSFCSVSEDNVIITTLKKCDDDDNLIVRCYDAEGKDAEAKLQLFVQLAGAELTNIIEEEGQQIPCKKDGLSLKIGHHSIETIKLLPATPITGAIGQAN